MNKSKSTPPSYQYSRNGRLDLQNHFLWPVVSGLCLQIPRDPGPYGAVRPPVNDHLLP